MTGGRFWLRSRRSARREMTWPAKQPLCRSVPHSRGTRTVARYGVPVVDLPSPVLKPRLRGVFHELGLYAAIPLGVALGLEARGRHAQVSAAVFAAAVVLMFGASALYHRFTWSLPTRLWLRRVDHAGIFGLIAGTYTPFGLLVIHGALQVVVLSIVWGGAALAIMTKLLWVTAPKWLSAITGVMLGWVA